MPTIDELDAALAAADTDLLPASQGGVLRAVSRAQLLAGMQPQISVAQGLLLGGDAGDAPGPVSVGPGLSLDGGILSAPAPSSL